MLRDNRPFHFQQPFFCLQAFSAAVTVELAVCTNKTVTGNDERHRICGICTSHRTISKWAVDLCGDFSVGACFPIWDFKYSLQGFLLEGAKDRPVDAKRKCAAPAFQILA